VSAQSVQRNRKIPENILSALCGEGYAEPKKRENGSDETSPSSYRVTYQEISLDLLLSNGGM